MGRQNWTRVLIAVAMAATLGSSITAAQIGPWRDRDRDRGRPGWNNNAYEQGFREGRREGEEDARRGRGYDLDRNRVYRDGDRGYNDRSGDRGSYRDQFRRGFAEGYRSGYERFRSINRRDERFGRRGLPYGDPASARGFSDGYDKGREDGRDGDRYDPIRHGDYRDGDEGYNRSYGSKDAYKNNYRAGFRQGYEEGYRDGSRTARR